MGIKRKRSALAAVERKNAKLITRAIEKFYNGLFESNVLDHLFIFDENGDYVHHLSQEKISKFDLTQISVDALNKDTAHATISGFSLINNEICSVVIFKIFSNGRVVGQVMYAKKILPLVNDFVSNAEADYIAIAGPNPLYTENYISFEDFKIGIENKDDLIAIGSNSKHTLLIKMTFNYLMVVVCLSILSEILRKLYPNTTKHLFLLLL